MKRQQFGLQGKTSKKRRNRGYSWRACVCVQPPRLWAPSPAPAEKISAAESSFLCLYTRMSTARARCRLLLYFIFFFSFHHIATTTAYLPLHLLCRLLPSTPPRLLFLLLFRIGSDRLYFIISCACRKQTLEEEEEGWRMRRGRAKCFFHSLCRTVACDPLFLHSEALSIAPVF